MSSGLLENFARRLSQGRRRRRHSRAALAGVLGQARGAGFEPATIIDVGAAYGDFARECAEVFPDGRYLLVEPLEEYAQALRAIVAELPRAEFVQGAAASSDGEITIHVHGDLVGSSLYLEQEDSAVNGVPRQVRSVMLDSLRRELDLEPPFLLKVDVQGAELDVLAGASELLREAEYVLLEVSFFEFFAGGPQFGDVIAAMREYGFAAYDISGLQYRPLDGALSQADISFVPEQGRFREHHFYATREQRERQDRSLERRQKGRRRAGG